MYKKLLNISFIHFLHHLLLAVGTGILVWILIHDTLMAIFGIFLSLAVDLDHLIEYLIWSKGKFIFEDFFSGIYFWKKNKIYIIFHGWEYVVLGLLFWWQGGNVFWIVLSLALFFHLVFDTVVWKTYWRYYFLFFRLKNNFNKIKISERNGRADPF